MRRVFSILALAGLSLGSACSPASPPESAATKVVPSIASLRIAIPGLDVQGCQPTSANLDATAYLNHLKARLEKPVLLCGVKDGAAAAAALGAGDVEMALLGPDSFLAVQDKALAIIAPRFDPAIGRVLALAVTLKSSGLDSKEKLQGRIPIFIGEAPPSRAIPLQALSDHGVDTGTFGPAVLATENTGFQALLDGKGDMLIITAGARQRICRAENPKGGICPDVIEAWRGRPTAPQAFVVRADMSEADRYQLIGIHIALHKDSQPALAFVSNIMPKAIMLDPSEATALLKGTR